MAKAKALSHEQEALKHLTDGKNRVSRLAEQPKTRDSLEVIGIFTSAVVHALLAVAQSNQKPKKN